MQEAFLGHNIFTNVSLPIFIAKWKTEIYNHNPVSSEYSLIYEKYIYKFLFALQLFKIRGMCATDTVSIRIFNY